jgi:hypothetical protein
VVMGVDDLVVSRFRGAHVGNSIVASTLAFASPPLIGLGRRYFAAFL